MKRVIILVIIAFICFLVLLLYGSANSNKPVQETTVETYTTVDVAEISSPNIITDEVVNRFVTEYNDSYDITLDNIAQGKTTAHYSGYIGETKIEMMDGYNGKAQAFVISIYNDASSNNDGFIEIIINISKILEPTLNDDIISLTINNLIDSNVLTEKYLLGDTLTISYIPVDKSDESNTKVRLEISTSDYKDLVVTDNSSEEIEMNSLQEMFASLKVYTTIDDVKELIDKNNFESHEFSYNTAYNIGYTASSVSYRSRDRIGEAVDITFYTDKKNAGKIKTAEYALHYDGHTRCILRFESGMYSYSNGITDEKKLFRTSQEAMNYVLNDEIFQSEYGYMKIMYD